MKRRNDIQGLRALAVTLVILGHLEFQNEAFRGGFIGVDVFFVISGFIITSLLIREYSRNADTNSGYGWISLRAFYFRRVKRIIPAATLVIVTTVATSYFLFNNVKAGWIRRDGFFSSIFLANINLIQQKTDYFSQSIAQSPLEHYWSLSVEEQFYLVIPFLILIAVSFHGVSIGRFKLWWERRVMLLLAVITLASFIWSLIQTPSNPQSSYFSTLTRAWEIGAGGLLALLTFQKESKLSKKLASLIAASCLTVILVSSFVFNANSRFPGYFALVPVLSTALLIYVGGTNPNNMVSRLLSLRPFVFIGEISFSLYLWHLPVIVILGQNFQLAKNPALETTLLILLTLTLTLATYHFVEKPCRDYPMPESWESNRHNLNLGQPKFSQFLENAKVRQVLVGVLSLTVLLGGYKSAANIVYARPIDPPPVNLDFTPQGGLVDDLSQTSGDLSISPEGELPTNSESNSRVISISNKTWQSKIAEGVQLGQAPADIVNNISALTVDRAFSSDFCKRLVSSDFQSASKAVFSKCEIPNAPLALFIGNSHGAMLLDAVGKSLNELGFSVNGIFTSSCTVSPKVIPLLNSTPVEKCKSFAEDLAGFIKNKKPDLIVISEDLNASVRNASGASVMGPAAADFLISNITDAIRDFQSTTSRVVLFDAFPRFPQISSCMTASGQLNSCVTKTDSTEIYRQINKTVASNTGVQVISTLPWVCHQRYCPAIIGDTLVSPDGSHVSSQLAAILQNQIKNSLNIALKSFSAENLTGTDTSSSQKQQSAQNILSYTEILTKWKKEVASGVGVLSTQNLTPAFSKTAGVNIFNNPDCGTSFSLTGISLSKMNPCLISGGTKNAVFIGNSHARMLQYTVSQSMKLRGYNTYSLSIGSCVVANVTPVVNSLPTKDCEAYRSAIQGLLSRVKPEVVIVSESGGKVADNFLPPGAMSVSGISRDTALFWREYEKALVTLKQNAKHLIVIGEKPHLPKNPIDCVDGSGKLDSSCVGSPAFINSVVQESKKAVASAKGNFIDVRDWLCTSQTCPAIIGKTLVYTDISHLSYPIQAKLLPLFEAYLRTLGL